MRLVATALGVFLLGASAAMAAGEFTLSPRDCDAPSESSPVCLAPEPWSEAEAAGTLGTGTLAAIVRGDTLTVLARRARGPVSICCTIAAPLTRIGDSEYWAVSLKIYGMRRAALDFQAEPEGSDALSFIGPDVANVPTAPRLLGSLVEDTIDSTAMDSRRHLTVYLPPGHDSAQSYPVVYLADGATVRAFAPAIEALIVTGRARPMIVVGLWPAQNDPRARGREYLVGNSASDYSHHSAFVFDEVMPFVERRYGASARPQDRVVAGFSDGAAWALSFGLRHTRDIGTICAFSLGWPAAAEGVDDDDRPRLYLAGGFLEPGFHRVTAEAARRARSSRAPLLFEEFASGHALIAWQAMLLDALAWTFPRRP